MGPIHKGLTLVAGLALAGCAAAAIQGSANVVQGTKRAQYMEAAEAGDAYAQYEVGKSYCCKGVGFSAQTATEWLCKAAQQGEANAQFELARIYDGDVSRMPSPAQKLLTAVREKTSPEHALLWATLAADQGHEEAQKLLAKLNRKAAVADQTRASELFTAWREAACEYDAVYAAG